MPCSTLEQIYGLIQFLFNKPGIMDFSSKGNVHISILFIKLYITFSPKKELLPKNLFINSVFYRIFPHILLFDSKLDHNSALHAKIREKSLLIESRIEFPYPILMTLDRGKISGKIILSQLWFLIQKLDHNSALHAKNQREISH